MLVDPIPQDPTYHDFADSRTVLGVPNGMDVLSNLPFTIVGVLGLVRVLRRHGTTFVDPRERWAHVVFFASVAAVGPGSGWYHLAPGNESLVWDRLALVGAPAALFAALLGERLSVRTGARLLPLLVAGALATVVLWAVTESAGRGDLRAYGFAQFYPAAGILVLLALGRRRYTRAGDYLGVIAWYALAKAFELADEHVYELNRIVSGHTLKHLAAAAGTTWILRMLRLRRPAPQEPPEP
jgi:hypothetical protein